MLGDWKRTLKRIKLRCIFDKSTGVPEWDVRDLAPCELRSCSVLDEMMNSKILDLFYESDGYRMVPWKMKSYGHEIPPVVSLGVLAQYKCLDNRDIFATCNEENVYMYTAVWPRNCKGYSTIILF